MTGQANEKLLARLRIELALSESSRNIERTNHWEVYAEALGMVEDAERKVRAMEKKVARYEADRAEVVRRKSDLGKVDAAVGFQTEAMRLRQQVADLEAALAKATGPKPKRVRLPEETLAQLEAERTQWVVKKRKYVLELEEINFTKLWLRGRSGSDVY